LGAVGGSDRVFGPGITGNFEHEEFVLADDGFEKRDHSGLVARDCLSNEVNVAKLLPSPVDRG